MRGEAEVLEEGRGGARLAVALAAVGLASFQGAGLAYYHLFRAGGDFDRNFLTGALLAVEGALGLIPSLLLAGLVLHGGVATFVNGALRLPLLKAAAAAGSVLFAAGFLSLAEGPSFGGALGARLAGSAEEFGGKWGGMAVFGASAVLALWIATEGFFAPERGRGPEPGGAEGAASLLPAVELPPAAPLGEALAAAPPPKPRVGGSRYGGQGGADVETATPAATTDGRAEGDPDAGFDEDARGVPSERRGGDRLRAGAGAAEAEDDPAGALPGDPVRAGRRRRDPPVDVDRGGDSPGPDAGAAEAPLPVAADSAAGGAEAGRAGARLAAAPSPGPASSAEPRAAAGEVELVQAAGEAIFEAGRASVSVLQSRLGVSFLLASRLLERLERLGLVGPYRGGSARDILLARPDWERRPRGA